MNINIDDLTNLGKKIYKKPFLTILLILLLIVILFSKDYFSSFFNEKGKQAATPHSNTTKSLTYLYETISVGEKSLDNPIYWRRIYANYVFEKMFYFPDSLDYRIRLWTGWIFCQYFISSYTNKLLNDGGETGNWVNALWDIRENYGQDFTDKALFYTSKIEPGMKLNFNQCFMNRFMTGVGVIDNNWDNHKKILEILKKYNLF